MSVELLDLNGVFFNVYYECKVEKDPYGTGDSPSSYDVDILAIEAGEDCQDIQDYLATSVFNEITQKLIEIEASNG